MIARIEITQDGISIELVPLHDQWLVSYSGIMPYPIHA